MWLSITVTPAIELQALHSRNKQHRTAKHQWVTAHYAFRVAESLQTKPVAFASAQEVPHGSQQGEDANTDNRVGNVIDFGGAGTCDICSCGGSGNTVAAVLLST